MTIEHFKAEGIDLTKAISSVIYVDGTNGDDANSGDITSPKKTIGNAVTTIINTYSGVGAIKVGGGFYAETITLESESLTRLSIEALANPGSVAVSALNSTQDNENLTNLVIQGINFVGSVNLSCDVSGAGSLFGSEQFLFSDSEVSGSFTLKCMGSNASFGGSRVLDNVTFQGATVIEHIYNLFTYRCVFNGTFDCIYNSANPLPQFGAITLLLCYETGIFDFPNMTSTAAFANQILLYSGCQTDGYGSSLSTIDANSRLTYLPGSQSIGHNPATGLHTIDGTLIIYPGVSISNWSTNFDLSSGEVVFGGSTLQPGTTFHVDATSGNDKFNGTPEYPLATIGAAVTALASGGGAGFIKVAAGTYAETLTLEDTALTSVDITSEGGLAVINAFQSKTNNGNIRALFLRNLHFTGNFELEGVDGGDLCNPVTAYAPQSSFENIIIGGAIFTLKALRRLRMTDIRSTSASPVFENCQTLWIEGDISNVGTGAGTFTIQGVDANPKFSGFAGSMSVYFHNGSIVNGDVTLSNDIVGRATVLAIQGAFSRSSTGDIDVQDQCKLRLDGGWARFGSGSQIQSGGTLELRGAYQIPSLADWTIDPGATITREAIEFISATKDIVAATGIISTMLVFDKLRIQSSTAGDTNITANPQVANGLFDGQQLHFIGQDDTKTVTFDDGAGLKLAGGLSVTLGEGDSLVLTWDDGLSLWVEDYRTDT